LFKPHATGLKKREGVGRAEVVPLTSILGGRENGGSVYKVGG